MKALDGRSLFLSPLFELAIDRRLAASEAVFEAIKGDGSINLEILIESR
jgi:hypothetical protein